jgi:hypothetical protein
MSKQYRQIFRIFGVAISIAVLWPTMMGWCQNLPQVKSSTPPKNKKKNCDIKTLKIQWQRLLIDDETCPRCGVTEQEIDKAYMSLKQSLSPLGIMVVLEKKALDLAVFKKILLNQILS